MSFEDLPPDWAERPLTDPDVTADVLDLVIRDADRAVGSVAALLCNRAGRLVQPVVIAMPRGGVTARDRRLVLDTMCAGVVRVSESEPGSLLVAVARPQGRAVTGADRAWRDSARLSCADHGVRLLATWLVTREAILPVDVPVADQRSA
jgi:hypothetical protein